MDDGTQVCVDHSLRICKMAPGNEGWSNHVPSYCRERLSSFQIASRSLIVYKILYNLFVSASVLLCSCYVPVSPVEGVTVVVSNSVIVKLLTEIAVNVFCVDVFPAQVHKVLRNGTLISSNVTNLDFLT